MKVALVAVVLSVVFILAENCSELDVYFFWSFAKMLVESHFSIESVLHIFCVYSMDAVSSLYFSDV